MSLKKFLTVVFLFFFTFGAGSVAGLSSSTARAESPGLMGALSVVPGLGQAVQGNPWEGLGWFSSTLALVFVAPNSYLKQIGFDLWMYNMGDSYRDAGGTRGGPLNVYLNYLGALNPLNVVDPVGASIVATGAIGGYASGYPTLRSPAKIALYGFVGLGEEGLFRGFLFPSISGLLSSRWAGAALSSGIFALAHAANGKQDLEPAPLTMRFLFGMLLSWQLDRNQYDLRKNIFAHAWYDIFVDSEGRITGGSVRIPFRF